MLHLLTLPGGLTLLPPGFFLFAAFPLQGCDASAQCAGLVALKTMNSPLPTEWLLKALVADAEEAIICFHLNGCIGLWNAAAERLYGYTAGEVLGRQVSLILPLCDIPTMETLVENTVATSARVSETVERLGKSGTQLLLHVERSIVRNEAGLPMAILEKAVESSARLSAATAETHLHPLIRQMSVAFWTADFRLRITSHWDSGFQGLRVFQGNPPGQSVHEYLQCKQNQETPVKQHLDALNGICSRFEYRRRKRIFEISLEPLRNASGSVIGCIGVALDITERKKSEEEIRHQATHDGLTGLANYRKFVNHLEDEVRRAERNGQPFGVLLLDLDGLKLINDRLGHLAGNRALKRLARAMKDHSRATDIAARYGGDEFGILLIDADYQMCEQVAGRIRDCLALETGPPRLTVSIGVAVYPADGRTAQDLLEIADRRLYREKKAAMERFQTAIAE